MRAGSSSSCRCSLNLDSYLARISYSGPLAPTLENLRAIHYAHLLAVPFENLDIHRGMPIALDQEYLYDKIVLRRRGGFCYELNSLFAALLREWHAQARAATA